MTNRTNTRPRSSDAGFTLIELLLVVVLTGILIGPIAMGISTVLTASNTSRESIGESQDLRQVVNFLPDDVRSGSILPSGYAVTSPPVPTDERPVAQCGANGPADTGVRLVIEATDVTPQFVYAFEEDPATTPAASTRFYRYECSGDVTSKIMIADGFGEVSTTYVLEDISEADLAAGEPRYVERIEMTLSQESGTQRVVTASPLRQRDVGAGEQFVEADCFANPLGPTFGFDSFTFGDLRLESSDKVTSVAVAGSLSWADGAQFKLSSPASIPEGNPGTVLYVGAIDWANSDGVLKFTSSINGTDYDGPIHVVITNGLFTTEVVEPDSTDQTVTRIYQDGADPDSSTYIEFPRGDMTVDDEGPIDFAEVQEQIESCALALVRLPGSYPEFAAHIFDQDGAFDFHDDLVNVLNATSDDLNTSVVENALRSIKVNGGGAVIGENNPLIINVIDCIPAGPGPDPGPTPDCSITLDPAALKLDANIAPYVLFNFYEASTVILQSELKGAILAPGATIEYEGVRGQQVSQTSSLDGGGVDSFEFDFAGILPWVQAP